MRACPEEPREKPFQKKRKMLSVEEFWKEIGRHNNTLMQELDAMRLHPEKTNYMAVVCKTDQITKLSSPILMKTYGNGHLLYILLESLLIMLQLEHTTEAVYLTQVIFGAALCRNRSAVEDESVDRWFRPRYKMGKLPHFLWSDWQQTLADDFSGTILKLPLRLEPVMKRIAAPEPWVELI